jgi:conjugative transfer region protein TrbK
MGGRFGLGRLPVIAMAAAVVLSVAACAIELRRGEDQASTESPASKDFDPLKARLEQCRTVTSEQTAALDECRRVWSENRSRFLGGKSTQTTTPNTGAGNGQVSTPPSIKDQGRLPKGYPPIAPLESE